MALKTILNTQEDFTGEFPAEYAKSGLWRFNESTVDENNCVDDSSGCNRKLYVNNWKGTTACFTKGQKGNYLSINLSNPVSEQNYLIAQNDGSFFSDLGKRIICGGWIYPTTYSVENLYCPLFNTRYGPGQPIMYLSLYDGWPRLMLYDASGNLIVDEVIRPTTFSLLNGGAYFLAVVIEVNNRVAHYVIADRDSGECWISNAITWTGELNRECTADIIMGMHADSYWYAGGFDDWFLDTDSELSAEDLRDYFYSSLCANGGDTSGNVDAITESGVVTLRATNGAYPTEGTLYTAAAKCGLSGTGRVQVSSETTSGVTAVTDIQTSTSDDLLEWSEWADLDANGKLISPNRKYIRFKVTLTTTKSSETPRLTAISLYDDISSKSAYNRLGYANPVVLDENGAWEAVLENAYDVVVTSEINGEDCLNFSLPFTDEKRQYLNNEKSIQIASDIYRIRTITDKRDTKGSITTEVYAEAEFYDLAYSVRREEHEFDAATASEEMEYALSGTDWSVGMVEPSTKRTWTCSETNALAILRQVADLHGGDLVFDCANHLVHLYTAYGSDNGVTFAYRKNMKSIERVIDTTSLVTRLYATGADGMTFSDINDGKPYVEDFTYSKEVRISSLDCSSFTNPYQMLEYTKMRLADFCQPTVSYVLNAMDLSVLTAYEHEEWALGDYIRVVDEDLGLSITTRLVRREYNLKEPWNTVLELSTVLKNLASSASTWDNAADTLEGTSVISASDLKEMVPFNLLRNSRADDGLAYWTSSGFEADGGNGASGTASFKAEGTSGMALSLSQTVYPANRSSYTISAEIASEDLKKLSDDSQVGIEIEIEYEDGTTETRFIDLY